MDPDSDADRSHGSLLSVCGRQTVKVMDCGDNEIDTSYADFVADWPVLQAQDEKVALEKEWEGECYGKLAGIMLAVGVHKCRDWVAQEGGSGSGYIEETEADCSFEQDAPLRKDTTQAMRHAPHSDRSVITVEEAPNTEIPLTRPQLQLDKTTRISWLTWKHGRLYKGQEDRRPLSQAPHSSYSMFEDEQVPMDKLVVEMSPTGPESRTKWRDFHVEYELLKKWNDWAIGTEHEENCGPIHVRAHCRFHTDLVNELELGLHDFGDELHKATSSFTGL